jgi:hypothetical protein
MDLPISSIGKYNQTFQMIKIKLSSYLQLEVKMYILQSFNIYSKKS